jgi:hypothetical protein
VQLILIPRDQRGVHSTKSIPKAEQRSKCFMLTASAPRLLARALRAGIGGSAAARRDVPSGPFIVCLDTHRDALARLGMQFQFLWGATIARVAVPRFIGAA